MSAQLHLSTLYKKQVYKKTWLCLALVFLLLVAFISLMVIGAGTLSIRDVFDVFFNDEKSSIANKIIIWDIRLPMAITALLVGVMLSISGSLMQTVLKNPLAEPFTFGIAAAAGFGAALSIVFSHVVIHSGIPLELVMAISAFAFSMLTVMAVVFMCRRFHLNVEMMTLLGIAVHFVFSSLLSLMQYFANADQLQTLVFWLLGSVSKTSWMMIYINLAICLVLMPILMFNSWKLTAIKTFGDKANVLGINVERVQLLMLLSAALIAGIITATVGIIGFVGLVAPHMARFLVGEDQRFNIPVTLLSGGLMVVLAAIISQVLIPGAVIPIGIITALIGIPVFVVQIFTRFKGAH